MRGLSPRRTLRHRELSPRGPARRGRVAGVFFDQKKLAGFDVVKKTKDINCLGVPREFRTFRTSALMIGLGVAGK